MANLSKDKRFVALVASTESMISTLAEKGVPDAISLAEREQGVNNLQGHYRRLVPLAVSFIREHPEHLSALRESTDLDEAMGRGSSEARDDTLWEPIQSDLKSHISKHGKDIISAGSPETVQEIAHTYLSTNYGGSQTTGQGGNTVFKRTLKIMAHTLPRI